MSLITEFIRHINPEGETREDSLIKERQREGIALAKQRGAYRGRKKALPEEKVAQLQRRITSGEKKARLAREFGISRETLYQYLRRGAK